MKRILPLLVTLVAFLASVPKAAPQTTTKTANFSSCPIGNLTGVFDGINWSGTPWDCENAGYSVGTTASWTQQITSGSFSFVSPSVLTGFQVGGEKMSTLKISTDAGESITESTPANVLTTYTTGFVKPATKITVSNSAGWYLEMDNIVYTTSTTPPPIAVSISPTSVSLVVNATQQFTDVVSNTTSVGVGWAASCGTVSLTGLYTAPSTPGTCTVTVTSLADNTKSATATVTVTAVPIVSVTISPTSATLAPGGTRQFTATVTGTTAAVTWAQTGGTVSSAGLYTAGSTTGAFSVTAAVTVGTTTTSATATITISSSGSNVIFYDNFPGTTLSSAWTVISRHGEYSQGETECNVPQMVTVNNGLTITTEAQSATCGDYFTAPSSWPYITGDIQWATFNFTYGTVEIYAKFPPIATALWPATWLLGSNCQYTNPLTGNTGVTINGHTCPAFGASGYTEIDMTECYGGPGGWCGFSVYDPGSTSACNRISYSVDTNWHLFTTVWTSSSVKQYMDGNLVTTCHKVITNPMFLIIQTQTGGVAGTPNNSDLPAQLQIGYVQVTQP